MPIRMVATRRFYNKEEGREYEAGQGFAVADGPAADKLEKFKKAKRAPEMATQPPPSTRTRAMRAAPKSSAETPAAPEPTGSSPDQGDTSRYLRRDLRSEP